MRITILNGNPDRRNASFNKYLEKLRKQLDEKHIVECINLYNKKIIHCTGCFGCWTRKPGECVVKDDTFSIRKSYINSDLVIFASPVIMGFTSALLKTTVDKLIPLLHPYFEFVKNEVHHRSRYNCYPRIGVILGIDARTDDEDIKIITAIYRRMALNFKSTVSFVGCTKNSSKDLVDAVNHI